MNTTVPADPRLRKRALLVVLTALLTGVSFLSFFHGFLREVEALAIASPQMAVEKLNPLRNAARGIILFSATVLAGLLAHVSLRVFRAGQWPPPEGR
jgi:hypothetical protein